MKINYKKVAVIGLIFLAFSAIQSTSTDGIFAAGTPPVITYFTATPATILKGQSSTLSWSVSGATLLSINQGVGTVTGTSKSVSPAATTTYTLTATNASGSKTATVTVTIGSLPVISSLTASPTYIQKGQNSILYWTVSGATTLSINQGIGTVTGIARNVAPTVTTTYTLTAANGLGAKTASITVNVGSVPVITSFSANPTMILQGGKSTLTWSVTGAATLAINMGMGSVTGTTKVVTPAATTIYTLTATNPWGTKTAQATVTIGTPPVIAKFYSNFAAILAGQSAKLVWTVSGGNATLSLNQGIGNVTGTTCKDVSPAVTTCYTLTAINPLGTATASTTIGICPLVQVNSQLFYTEHCVFIIPTAQQVNWASSDSWSSVYAKANIDGYVNTLNALFPDNYFFVVVAANKLTPNRVPEVYLQHQTASGIGLGTLPVGSKPNICRYNCGGGTVIDGVFGVLDHEIGHNWGVFIGAEVGNGHWLPNSTTTGQMAERHYLDTNTYATFTQISGDAAHGFTWAAVDNIQSNEFMVFSDHDLYLQGLSPTFPDLYVLQSPTYNANHTVSYTSATKYDQNWVVQKNGIRTPSYQTSEKKFRIGTIYIARDIDEVHAVCVPVERSINHFVNAEQIDNVHFRFEMPFLVTTNYRASVNGLLADLDGNKTPVLTITSPTYQSTNNGSASVQFTTSDTTGIAPVVSFVPAQANCKISGNTASITGLTTGSHFFTIKAQDAGGKKAFAHFVIDAR